MSSKSHSASSPPGYTAVAEVRYSLPQLLREVDIERRAPAFAMEKLDQTEIAKVFARKGGRRASTKR